MFQQTPTKQLNEIFEVAKGKKVSISPTKTKNSVPYLLIDTLRGAEPEFFTEDKKYTLAEEKDILMVFDGANSGLVGTGLKGAVGSTIARLRLKEDMNTKYITYFLSFNFSNLNQDIKGSAIPHVKPKKLLELNIRYPSLSEQQQIVSAIETQFTRLDVAVKNLKRVKQKLGIYRKAVLKREFEKGEETSLGGVFEIIMGQSPPSEFYNKEGRGLPFFQGKKEFNYKYPDIQVWTEKYNKKADKGDLLISIRAPIGPCNIASEKCAIGRGIAAIKAKNEVESHLLFYLIKYYEQQLDSKGTGTTFKAISKNGLNSFMVKLPPNKDWKQIVSSIESKFSVIDKVEETVDNALIKAERLRKSILKSVFEGKLVKEEGEEK